MEPEQVLAQIEYYGIAGSSLDCEAAIVRLVQTDAVPKSARILTFGNKHGFLLTTEVGDQIAVKSGFASGYGGTGPNSLSLVLQMLSTHGCEVDEFGVSEPMLARLDRNSLTEDDLSKIVNAEAVRPSRWTDYILERHTSGYRSGQFWREVSPVLPYPMIDDRIFDLALNFNQSPNDSILHGYRRLEDMIRERIGSSEHGQKLLTKAFVGDKSLLHWNLTDQGEHAGRCSLFVGAFLAHRNPRAHRELEHDRQQQIEEFFLLNMLFRLESQATARETTLGD